MMYAAVFQQFKEEQFERFCQWQERYFHAPYISENTGVHQSRGEKDRAIF